MAAKNRAYKSDYARLFDNPSGLFGPGVEVKLWPNGKPVIWIRETSTGRVFEVKAGSGPAGFGVTVHAFNTFDAIGNTDANEPGEIPGTHEVELCQFNTDSWSQAYRAWYRGNGEHPGERP